MKVCRALCKLLRAVCADKSHPQYWNSSLWCWQVTENVISPPSCGCHLLTWARWYGPPEVGAGASEEQAGKLCWIMEECRAVQTSSDDSDGIAGPQARPVQRLPAAPLLSILHKGSLKFEQEMDKLTRL